MWLVHGVQKGKIPSTNVSGKVNKAAKTMSASDVKDFLMQERGLKECGSDIRKRILSTLKELSNPLTLQTEEPAVPDSIASTKTFHGDFDNTLKMYRGFEFTPKENQAILNFTESKPTTHDKFKVEYSKGDDFGNNSKIVIKKLRENTGKFVFVAIIKVRAAEEVEENPPPQSPQSPEPQSDAGEEIKLVKSSLIDDQSGDEILTNFLQSVFRTKA